MKATVIVCALTLLSVGAHAQDSAARSTADGVFTEEQAGKGERAYQAHCAGCHGLDLRRIDPEAPDLTEGPFRFAWQDKTMAERFEKIRATMPRPNVRSLDDQVYLDIIAYLLRANGVPAGSQPLEPNVEALEKIIIAIPASPPGSTRRRR
jgi:mono/diheme cytochrome c family protein